MSEFKVGDTVKCIDTYDDKYLVLNKEYTVLAIYDNRISVEEGTWNWERRFKMVENKLDLNNIKVGDKVLVEMFVTEYNNALYNGGSTCRVVSSMFNGFTPSRDTPIAIFKNSIKQKLPNPKPLAVGDLVLYRDRKAKIIAFNVLKKPVIEYQDATVIVAELSAIQRLS